MAADFWKQRGIFRGWVEEAKQKLGAPSNAAVSERLGLTPSTLYKYLSASATHKPSPEALKKLGDLIGRDYRLLMDGPEHGPGWLDGGEWSELSERDRFIARTMFQDLTADQLTEAEKDELFRAYKEAKERIMRLRKAFREEKK